MLPPPGTNLVAWYLLHAATVPVFMLSLVFEHQGPYLTARETRSIVFATVPVFTFSWLFERQGPYLTACEHRRTVIFDVRK